MNSKEIGELRRRLKPEKTSITHIFGCYVNEKQEIVSEFDQPIGNLSEDEAGKVLSLLRRSMSGSQGKNLHDLVFSTQEVANGTAHSLLMKLREKPDEYVLHSFFDVVRESVMLETSYLILLARDTYDVPFKGKDGLTLPDGSEDQFQYVMCAICPVKLAKPVLTFVSHEGTFQNRPVDFVVGAPELGFLFPAFDDRATNLYGALYYTHSLDDNQPEFVQAVFHAEPPMAANQQKEEFQNILSDSLGDSCSMTTVQAVQGQLCALIQEHKDNKEPDLLTLNKGTVKGVLASCGVAEEQVESFGDQYDECFGEDSDITPTNLVNAKRMEVTTPDVSIKVNPERPELIQTRTLGGAKFILIRAEEGVELNGVPIQIQE